MPTSRKSTGRKKTSAEKVDALILGAGVCGLAAAWRLLERDPSLNVVLLEKEERPGGLARSLTINGQVTDLGPHRIFTELPDVQEFLQSIAGDELTTVHRKSKMWLRDGWIDYPPRPLEVMQHLGVGTLASAGFSYVGEKVSNFLDFHTDMKDESFESLMREAFGPQLYKLLIEPYTKKVWKVDPAQLHADIARVRVSAGGLDQMIKKLFIAEKGTQITAVKKFFYLPGGVETLVKKLRDGVEARGGKIITGCEVESVQGSTVYTKGKMTYSADKIISTISVKDLTAMLLPTHPNPAVSKAREELRFIDNFLVLVVADKPQVTDCQWLYFPESTTIFNRGYEPKNFHEGMGTKEQALLVLEITCHEGDKIYNASDKQLINATLKGLERIGLLRRDEVAATRVHRIPETYPLYDRRYRTRLAKVWRYLEQFPTLISAGRQGLFLHNNMDHSIHMGFRAADAMLTEDHPSAAFYSEVRRFQKFRIVD